MTAGWPARQLRARARRRTPKIATPFCFRCAPARPRFERGLHLPYTGSVNIDPKSIYPLEHFVAIAPKSASRQQATNRGARAAGKGTTAFEDEGEEGYEVAEVPAARGGASPPRAASSSMLLEALKEELFQLEVERQQGRISQQEYETAKSALDQTLQRALKREAQKA
jgi:hypothetical protein